jgi:hypothetical protein
MFVNYGGLLAIVRPATAASIRSRLPWPGDRARAATSRGAPGLCRDGRARRRLCMGIERSLSHCRSAQRPGAWPSTLRSSRARPLQRLGPQRVRVCTVEPDRSLALVKSAFGALTADDFSRLLSMTRNGGHADRLPYRATRPQRCTRIEGLTPDIERSFLG